MKRILALVLLFSIAVCLMGCGAEATPATTAAPSFKETTAPTLSYKEVAVFIKSQLESQFQYTDISYDETGMTIFLSMDDISTTCSLAKTGSDSMAEPWNNILSSTEDLSKSITESFRSIGYSDYVVSIVIANELNFDDILAMFLNGELVYNAAE